MGIYIFLTLYTFKAGIDLKKKLCFLECNHYGFIKKCLQFVVEIKVYKIYREYSKIKHFAFIFNETT